jgi:hypothetical protein
MVWFLVHGSLPRTGEEPADWPHGFGAGKLDAFLLWGRTLHLRLLDRRPELGLVLDELEELWRTHRDEIVGATVDETPWIFDTLREHGRLHREDERKTK